MLPKETAIDWLVERINHAKIEKILTTQRLYELGKIAKEIEKEQIIKATYTSIITGEDYYNKTYGDETP